MTERFTTLKLDGELIHRYKVSSYGRVYDEKKQTYVSPVLTGKPRYFYVNLQITKERRVLRRVHRLVLESFVEGSGYVDHIDINPYNNSLDNLRWVTQKDNQRNRRKAIRWSDGESYISFLEKYFNCSCNHLYHYSRKKFKRGDYKTKEDCYLNMCNYLGLD